MEKIEKKNQFINQKTLVFGIVHFLYWAIFCLMVAFASAFLLDKGLTNSVIGLILGISYLLSALTQPVVGSFFSSHSIPRSKGIAVIYIPVAVFAFLIRFLPLPPLVVGVLMVFMITVQSMMQPSINALYQSMETDDERINFGLARGMGSVSYALSSFIAGQLLAVFAPSILPLMYMVAVVLLVLLLMTIKTREPQTVESGKAASNMSYKEMLINYPHLRFFVPGMICLFLTYSFIDSFLIQILMSIGGNSTDLGTAITASAILELPAMVLYTWLCTKKLGLKIYQISMWIWLAKDILTAFATSPVQLFLIQMMGCACCAIYVPGMMFYMSRSLPPALLLRGATLAGTATTLGSLIATLVGGWLMDHAGVHNALMIVQIPAIAGTLLMNTAIMKVRKSQRDG